MDRCVGEWVSMRGSGGGGVGGEVGGYVGVNNIFLCYV